MKNTMKLFAISMVCAFYFSGCGGGSSSSSAPGTPPSAFSNSIVINPLRDLGLETGDDICFSIKSYNNTSVSDFSNAICVQINTSNSLTLSWNNPPGNVVGYYVYFGTKNYNATNFLADVFES